MSVKKSLLIPINSNQEIDLQDRTDYKLPSWGFFGGSIEKGESHLQAVMREAKEDSGLASCKRYHYLPVIINF